MKNFTVRFDENNSAGYYRLSKEDYDKLLKNGWKIYFKTFDEIRDLKKVFKAKNADNAIKNAKREWKRITKCNPNEIGCECCGYPFNFDILEDED